MTLTYWKKKLIRALDCCLLAFLMCLAPTVGFSIERPATELQDAGLSTTLGSKVNLNLEFQNSKGVTVPLSSFVTADKPLVIIPAYYQCPKLCGLLLSGASDLFNQTKLGIGEDYQVVTVSFNTAEGPDLADKREVQYRDKLEAQAGNKDGWNFLTGKDSAVKPLMKSLGFNYKKDKKDFAHTAALFILTADGRISQYLTGIEFSAWDFKLALVEASEGSIGSALDHVLLYCFRFDPLKGRYTLVAQNIMRAGGALTLVLLTGLIVTLKRREKTKSGD